ncbi:MAG: SGNH/GDSL hydrolase family protein [Candidatus Poseidoniaceae archaeon]|nr:SGNH/GDSL hydrolase family protein [Candidatus Poseidoniaceae archaeon]
MRKVVFVILLLLFVQLNVPIVNADSGRSANVELSVPKYDWFSNETVSISVQVSNSPFGVDLFGNWEVKDFNDDVVVNGTHVFQSSGTVTQFNVYMKHFFSGENFYFFSIEILDSSGSIVGDSDIPFMVFQNSKMPQKNNLLVFGDSLSDMGNAKNSILNVPDVPPYWQGRFSNGQIWIEYLSQAYGLSTTIGSGIEQGDNRAFGGSQTGAGYSYLLLPNTGTQITNYLANVQSSIPSNNVVSLWAGGNDFLYGTANSDTIVANMESHIRELAAAGATEFIMPNLPPLEKTPEILGRSQNQQNTIASEVVSYNQKLLSLIGSISVELGLEIHFIDAWTLFNDIVDNSMALGIVNTQDSACSASASLLPLPICNSASTLAANPDEYLFFDKAHPTRVMHKFISYFAIQSIGYAETDGDGVIDNYDLCPWTENGKSVDLDGCSWEQLDDDQDNIANGNDKCPSTIIGAIVDSRFPLISALPLIYV